MVDIEDSIKKGCHVIIIIIIVRRRRRTRRTRRRGRRTRRRTTISMELSVDVPMRKCPDDVEMTYMERVEMPRSTMIGYLAVFTQRYNIELY